MKHVYAFLFSIFFAATVLAQTPIQQDPVPQMAFEPGMVGNYTPDPSRNGSGSLGQSYSYTSCGLNYVTVSQRISTRFTPAGTGTPTNLTVAGIPAGSTIVKSFIWYGGLSSANDPTLVFAGTNYTATTIGTGPDVCWGYPGTIMFRADVTPSVTGNGVYSLTINDLNDNVNGLTMMVIYKNPAATYTGTIVLNDGIITTTGGTTSNTVTIPAPGCATTSAKAFSIIGDLQMAGFVVTMNGVVAGGTWNWWNYFEVSTSYGAAATTSATTIVQPGDCYFFGMNGVYYQTTCASTLSYTLNKTGCTSCAVSATITPSGSPGPYTYTWTPTATAGNTPTATALCDGSYTVQAFDNLTCKSATATFTVSALTATTTQTNLNCSGVCNGSATVTAAGGTAPYTYSWAPSGGSAATANSLCAGTYTCTITDNTSCSITKTVTITSPPLLSATTTQTNLNCNGVCSGTAGVTASGGTPGYTYTWTPSGGSAASASSLCAGSYTCTITDTKSCTATKTFVITQPPALTATISGTNAICYGACNGTATVSASGGSPGYTYFWIPTGGSAATATGLCAGTYTCTITDTKSCTLTKTITITQASAPITAMVMATNTSCNGSCNGYATLTVSGGVPGYTFAWAPSGGSSATAIGLCANTYTVTITDAGGCTATQTATITQPPPLVATNTHTDLSCFGVCNGTATVTTSGGSPAYTYNWSPSGGSAATATGLCPSTYTCTIADSRSCTVTQVVMVTQPTALTATNTHTDLSCNGVCNGTATVAASGGTPGYTYSWAPSGGSAATATSLCVGTYTCTITDSKSCTVTQTVTITQPPALTSTISGTNVSCIGSCNGTATVTPSGGSPGYTYSWAPSGGSAATATSLCVGTYTCTITDSKSCSLTKTVTITQPATGVSATITSTNISCNSTCDGTATASGSGGTAGYTYAWSPSGGSAATAASLCANTYTVTVTDANGCTGTQTVTITEPPTLLATATQTNVSCNTVCDGTATITTSGGTPGYTYTWAPSGGSAATATGLCAGTYTCTIRDTKNCSLTKTVTITQPTALNVSITSTNITCNGLCNGTATASGSGGTVGYTYAWTPSGGSAVTATGLCIGTYTCTITDSKSCTATQTITITQPAVLSATITATDATCNGTCNGTATVTPSGGTAGYTYSWAPSGGSGATATGLCLGTYTCTITDAKGCTVTRTATINQASALAVTITSTNISCNGICDGTANITVSGGTPSYTYTWLPSGGSGATASSLCANTYTCSVTDANGCSATQTVTITQPAVLTAMNTHTNVNCNGACNGTATVTAAGGSPGYTYAWLPSGGSAATTTALCAGTYTCTITDTHNCTVTQSITITQPPALAASTTQTNVTCNAACNGSATVTATGGTPSYTYAWSPSGGSGATAGSLCPGTYTCTITDASGCSITQTAVITEPPALAATTTHTSVTCNAACNGTATVTATGGTPSYTYAWTPSGGSGATASSLCATTYTCTITDAKGCTLTQTATITQPAALAVTATQTNVSCNAACNGSSTVTVSGGTPSYTYAWLPSGGSGATASSLCANTYTCTITDANTCTITQTVTITQPPALAATSTQTNVSCNGVCDGTATITATGGTPGYTYNWLPSGGSAATATNLCAGSYTCTITDAKGCTLTQIVTITQSSSLAATSTQTNISCNGVCDGTATITVGGGTPSYTYAWLPSGGSGANATALCAGTYTCTVTDANGCTLPQTVTITQPPALTVTNTHTNVTCNGACNGTAVVTATGGTAGYTYVWLPSGGSAATATSLCAGTYTCTITDTHSCTVTQVLTITEPTPLTITAAQTNVTCNAACNGTATVTVGGGTPSYAYAWAPGGGSGATATGLCAGTYTCTATDANGCTITQTVTITQPPVLAATTTQTNVSCNGVCDGTATVAATGGTPGYTYNWLPSGGSGATATNLCAGSYTCTITDANGCTLTQNVTITQASTLAANSTQTNISCNGVCDGTAMITATGGTPSYSYAWLPSGGSGANATALCAGTYTCTVTDANGCTFPQTVTITQPAVLAATTTSTNVSCNGACDGTATVTATGGTPGYAYNWLPSGGSAATATNLCAGTYTCTITDTHNCSVTQTVTITEPAALAVTATQTNVTCHAACNGTATVTVSGGTPSYTYAWSPSGGSTANATNLCAGTYTCTITDAYSCSITQVVTITEPAVLAASATQTNVTCNAACNGTATVTVSGGTPSYTYSWSPSGGTGAVASSLCAGSYTCTVTDANACSVTQTVTITEPPALAATTAFTNVMCNAACNGTATVTVTGGTPSYTYVWLPSGGSAANATSLCAGTYTCTITDANSCTITQIVTITEPLPLTATEMHTNVTCFSMCNGSAAISVSGGTPGYSYNWLPAGGSGASATNLCAANYTVTITDTNACAFTLPISITTPAALTASITITTVTCYGGSDGTATAVVNGGTAPYTYAWSNSATGVSTGGLAAGPIQVVVTDSNSCSYTANATVPSNAPVVITVNNDSICNGQTATLIANGAVSYAWNADPTLSSTTGDTVYASPVVNDTYTVIGTDANGCRDTAYSTVSVIPLPVISITGNSSICPGTSTTLTASGATSYTWAPAGSVSAPTAATTSASPAATTTYTVTGTSGHCPNTNTFTVTVYPQPNVTATGDSVCRGSVATISAAGAVSYNWTPATGLSSSSGTPVNATVTSTTNYMVIGTDANGCPDTATAQVTVIPLPVISVNSPSLCMGSTVALNASGAQTYAWSPATGLSATTGSSVNASPTVTSTYTITGTDVYGCINTGTSTVTLIALPQVSVFGDSVGCIGDVLTLNAATNGGGVVWSTGESTNSISVSPVTSGPYTATTTNSCGSSSVSIFVTIHSLPTANAGNDVTIGLGNTTTLHGTGGVSYSWYPSYGLDCSLCPQPIASPEHTTDYVLTATDINGCSDVDTVVVNVNEEESVFIPDIFSPDGDGHNDLFTVSGSGVKSLSLDIYDRWGQRVFSGTGEHSVSWDGTYKGATLNDAVFVYTLYITYYNGNAETKKGNLTLKK